MTEGAAGMAVIVLAVIALAGTAAGALASVATIVIGVGLMVQAFNSAAEHSKLISASAAASPQAAEFSGEVIVDILYAASPGSSWASWHWWASTLPIWCLPR